MNRFFVFEARRILPLFFLLFLLVGLSVYDNFFRLQPVDTAPVPAEKYTYLTTGRGELQAPTSFHLVVDQDGWEEVKANPLLQLPDYPFNHYYEVALCAINSEIKDMAIHADNKTETTRVEVYVGERPNYYHVVMVNRDQLEYGAVQWVFLDREGSVLMQKSSPEEKMVSE